MTDVIQLRNRRDEKQPTSFGYDLALGQTEVYYGYDPYNHVGADIVTELIDDARGPCIGVPVFFAERADGDLVAIWPGSTDLPHGADKERDDTEYPPGPISAGLLDGKPAWTDPYETA